MNVKNIMLTILFVILLILVIATYPTIYHLQSTNSQLKLKVEQLQTKNKRLQKQLGEQQAEVEKLTTEQNKENAEETAVRFIETLNSSSLSAEERLKKLKQMMTPSLYEQQFGSHTTDKRQETPVNQIRVKLEINQVIPAKIGHQVQVNVNYDLLTNVDNKENYTQKLNTVVLLSPQNNKWIIVDFQTTYLQGKEGDI